MGDYHVDGPNTPCVRSPDAEMAGRFQAELMTALSGWKERLGANPDHLVELEQQIHAAFSRGADLLIVGLMAVVTNAPEFAEACELHSACDAAVPLGRGRSRGKCVVRLLGGLMMWVTSLYCAPRKGWSSGRTNEKTPGMHVELVQFWLR